MSLGQLFDFAEAELRANRQGQLADSQSDRLAPLIARARRRIVAKAIVAGLSSALVGSAPLILVVVLVHLPFVPAVISAGLMAVPIAVLSLARQRADIAQASDALSRGAVQVAEGRVELVHCLSIPAMRPAYRLRLAGPEASRRQPVWAITRKQAAALARGEAYRVYHAGSSIQSVELSSAAHDYNWVGVQDRPPVRWRQ